MASPTTPGLFVVLGNYLYPSAGTYPLTISVQDSSGDSTTIDSTAVVTNNITTAPANFGFSGGLALNGVNGSHAFTGYTNTNQPTFSGTAVPFSTVQLYGKYWGIDAVQPLGEAVTNASGQWTLTVGPLAKGTYIITATVTPPGGYPVAEELTNNGLVYVNIAPKKPKHSGHHAFKPPAERPGKPLLEHIKGRRFR